MALTLAKIFAEVPGAKKLFLEEITCDNNYVTNGYLVNAALFNVKRLKGWVPLCTNTLGIDVRFDRANSKFKLVTSSTGAEVGNGSDQSAVKVYVLAWTN